MGKKEPKAAARLPEGSRIGRLHLAGKTPRWDRVGRALEVHDGRRKSRLPDIFSDYGCFFFISFGYCSGRSFSRSARLLQQLFTSAH